MAAYDLFERTSRKPGKMLPHPNLTYCANIVSNMGYINVALVLVVPLQFLITSNRSVGFTVSVSEFV